MQKKQTKQNKNKPTNKFTKDSLMFQIKASQVMANL